MIYFDQPYNTGNFFIYPDNLADPPDHYLRITRQKNGDGEFVSSAHETVGRYHSMWLSMIYLHRVMVRQLLDMDSVICVNISDHEFAVLKFHLNEVIGEENFIAQFVLKSRRFLESNSITRVSIDQEYLLAYHLSPRVSSSMLWLATHEQGSNLHFQFTDPATVFTNLRPATSCWLYSKRRMQRLIDEGCVLFSSNPAGWKREKKFKKDLQHQFMAFQTIINDAYTSHGKEEIREIFGFQVFDFRPSNYYTVSSNGFPWMMISSWLSSLVPFRRPMQSWNRIAVTTVCSFPSQWM